MDSDTDPQNKPDNPSVSQVSSKPSDPQPYNLPYPFMPVITGYNAPVLLLGAAVILSAFIAVVFLLIKNNSSDTKGGSE